MKSYINYNGQKIDIVISNFKYPEGGLPPIKECKQEEVPKKINIVEKSRINVKDIL